MTLWELIADYQPHFLIYGLLGLVIVYLFSKKSYKPAPPAELTAQEVHELLSTWKPQPFISEKPSPIHELDLNTVPVIERYESNYVYVDGKKLLNCGAMDFFGFQHGHPEIEEAAFGTLGTCGVGSCGPRNFYGTFDVHLKFEARISEFLGFDDTLLYASAFSVAASVIPVVASREDYILTDERVRKSIQLGNIGSRATVIQFRHNDMNDLEHHMRILKDKLTKSGSWLKTRCYVVVEGIYHEYGTLCSLREVVALAKQYGFRVLLDDSVALGTLGATGKGTLEHFGLKPSDVTFLFADISVLGSLGGICCGRSRLMKFQRINSSGYIFSASNPPFLVATGTKALNILSENPNLIQELQGKTSYLFGLLKENQYLDIESFVLSPLIMARLSEVYRPETELEESKVLQNIVDKVRDAGFLITRAKSPLGTGPVPFPQIRITVMVQHTKEDIQNIAQAIFQAVKDTVLSQ